MLNLNSSGLQMLMKAMGVDPQMIALKAAEFEILAKQFGERIVVDVSQMNLRLSNIEVSLIALHNKLDALANGGTFAGDSSVHLLAAPDVVTTADPTSNKEEKQTNGRRTTRTNRAHRSSRSESKSSR
jgi:tetrahydromethanopterin S-methyltransferase subunit B